MKATGDNPQNVNYAVKSRWHCWSRISRQMRPSQIEEVVAKAQKSVVLILIYRRVCRFIGQCA